MANEKRKPDLAPGPAMLNEVPNDDFTLCASLYYDSIKFYAQTEKDELNDVHNSADRHKRASILSIFSFFEAQINQVAFAYAGTHRDNLGTFELDVLEEKETKLNNDGTIQRNNKFYSTEARFRFLSYFLSGKPFDCSGQLWANFRKAQEIRHHWVHPKPPFDTWSLTLEDVKQAIITLREVIMEVSRMMNAKPPLWLVTFETALGNIKKQIET